MKPNFIGTLFVLIGISAAFAQIAAAYTPTRRTPVRPSSDSRYAFAQQDVPGSAHPADPSAAAWWTDRDAGLIGGIGGGVLGLLGGLVGTLGGCGVARRFVLPLTAVLAVLGVISLFAGVIALSLGQPYAVFYPLLLGGILVPAIMSPMFFLLRWSYQQRELRKMAAMDARPL
jgi:hypothetical protein